MKRSGLLVVVNNSYKLPSPPPTARRKRGRPPKRKPNADGMQPQPENAKPHVTTSGPGCPPEAMMNLVDHAVPAKRRGRGRQPGSKKIPGSLSKPNADLQPQPQPQPDVPINANPQATTSGVGHAQEARVNSVDQTVPAARRGRPPKAKSAKSAFSKGTSKNQIPFAPPDPAVPTETLTPNTVPEVSSDTSLPIKSSRGRGRPKKNATGLPHSGGAPVDVEAGNGGIKGPEDPAGRFVGQREKGTSSVEEDLRRKLEYFQSEVNESLAVFKHHFNRAIAAIQELEALAAMDLNAPQQLPEDDA